MCTFWLQRGIFDERQNYVLSQNRPRISLVRCQNVLCIFSSQHPSLHTVSVLKNIFKLWRYKFINISHGMRVHQTEINKLKILNKYSGYNMVVCGLQLATESHRSTRLLQLTGRYQYDEIMWLALRFLTRSATSQSSSYPIILTRLGGPRSGPNPHLKLWECRGSNPRPHDQ